MSFIVQFCPETCPDNRPIFGRMFGMRTPATVTPLFAITVNYIMHVIRPTKL